ncbi:ATP-binding protein [Nioella ostreopsis]|uniref:ATP-binding protein n=1 Tax=Nioella ostreopsis TaxID=2448479 RepID=UPI0013DEFB18|nr:ATP-binding protein [Nioella ostreopsis]
MTQDGNGPVIGPGTSDLEAMRDALRLYGHDIRAAVSDIIGGLRLMDVDRLPPDAQTHIERVRVAGETLAELVDGAMMLTSGQERSTAAASFDFRSFLAGIDLRWSGRAREQGLTFRVEIDRHVAERVTVARIKLDRILGNLIANALKFTDAGQVVLSVWQQNGDMHFQVRDQGRGFSDTALERLFTAGGRPEGQDRPGSGLGLHISKGLADGLGGSLRVENLPEGGADVTLTLPRATWECRDHAADMPDLSDLRILVAEDNETNQLLVRQMLDAMDARMILARDGQETLDLLAREPVDIALIDIEMPKLSGIEVMQRLRATPGFDTPLVALTAYVMRENREAIYAAGADGVIAKPIRSVTAFGQAIRRHVDRRSPSEATPPVAAPNGTLDRNRFEAILQAAGPSGRGELLDHLLQDLRSVQNALQQAVQANDTATTRAQSHILISLAGAIGADRLQNMAEALNAAAHKNRLSHAQSLVQSCDEALAALITQVDRRARREDLL